MRKLVACLVALAATTTANASLIVNGGFETGNLSSWTQSGNTGFTGVTTAPYNHSGTFGLFAGPVGSTGSISQNFMSGGGQVEISFWATNFSSGGTHSFEALLNGNALLTQINPAAYGYTQFTFLANTTAGSNTLEFRFRHDPSFFGLDDVEVNATPEPVSLVVFGGLIVGGVGIALRRRMASKTTVAA